MSLKALPVFVRVLCHCDQQQYLDVEPGNPGIEQRYPTLDKACLLEVANTTPAGRSGHSDEVCQFALLTRRITLQLIQKTSVRSR